MRVQEGAGARAIIKMTDGSMVRLKMVEWEDDSCEGCVFAHFGGRGKRACNSGYLLCMDGIWVKDEEGGEE